MVGTAETEIWDRIVQPSWDALEPEAAKGILRLQFGQTDIDSMNKLSELAQEGALDDGQRQQLDQYLRIGNMLTILHSKARQALKRQNQSSKER